MIPALGVIGRNIKNKCHSISYWWQEINKPLLISVLALLIIGVIAMYSISPATADRINASKFHFFKKHIFFVAACILIIILISAVQSEVIIWTGLIITPIVLIVLALTLFMGANIKGSSRWIAVPFMGTIQPSEFFKPVFIIANAVILNRLARGKKLKLSISLTLLALTEILLVCEPDIGSAIIYFSCWLLQFFVSGGPLTIILTLTILALTSMGCFYFIFPHVRIRIESFLAGPKELKYQVQKANQAISEGGFFGKGLGEGSVKSQLPDGHTDYIFAAVTEEIGWVLSILLIAVYFYIVMKIFAISLHEENNIKRTSLIGIAGLIGMQVFINIGVNLNILPSKGMTLPFISYGGSALLSMGIMTGIVLAFSKKDLSFNNTFNLLKTLIVPQRGKNFKYIFHIYQDQLK